MHQAQGPVLGRVRLIGAEGGPSAPSTRPGPSRCRRHATSTVGGNESSELVLIQHTNTGQSLPN